MSRKPQEKATLEELRDAIKGALDHRDFYLRYCPTARVYGSRLQARCPIPSHGHSGRGRPSLSVDLVRGLFHCFSRDEGGDAIRFYELMHGVTFAQAVREMASQLGLDRRQLPLAFRAAPDVDTERAEPLDAERLATICERFLAICRAEDQTEGLRYLARRAISPEAARRAGVTYFPRRAYRRVMERLRAEFSLGELQRSGLFNRRAHLTFYHHRLLFPFVVEGRARYLQARAIASGIEPRWHNLRGNVPALYNVDLLNDLASGAVVYLVEGFTDTLTLLTHDFAAVGLVGAGGLKEEWIALLGRFRTVALLDPDQAGRRAVARYREMFSARRLPLTTLFLPSDVNDFFRQRPSAALELALLTEAALDRQEAGEWPPSERTGYNL